MISGWPEHYIGRSYNYEEMLARLETVIVVSAKRREHHLGFMKSEWLHKSLRYDRDTGKVMVYDFNTMKSEEYVPTAEDMAANDWVFS